MNEELLACISNPRLKTLAQLGTLRTYRKSSILIEEGDAGSALYIVLQGRIKAFSRSADWQSKEVTYGVYGPGDLVGEMSLDGGPRSASVETLEPATCSVVPKEVVKQFIAQEPEFAFDLLAKVIERARQATTAVRGLAMNDTYGRLKDLLENQAKVIALEPESSISIRELPNKISHQELANQIGCSREMVSRLLKDLEKGGYVTQTPAKRIALVKPLPNKW